MINHEGFNWRAILFVLLAVGLLVLGYFALTPSDPGSNPSGGAAITGAGSPPAQGVTGTPIRQQTGTESTTASVSALTPPLSTQQVSSAASLATQFTQDYVSYRFDQRPSDVVANLKTQLSKDSQVDVTQVIPRLNLQHLLAQSHTVITAHANVSRVLLMSSNLTILQVAVTTNTTSLQVVGVKHATTTFDVTLDETGGTWGVSNITLSTAPPAGVGPQ